MECSNKEPHRKLYLEVNKKMWDLLNQFIPVAATTFINLAELALITLIGYGFIKFKVWGSKKLTGETPKAK